MDISHVPHLAYLALIACAHVTGHYIGWIFGFKFAWSTAREMNALKQKDKNDATTSSHSD